MTEKRPYPNHYLLYSASAYWTAERIIKGRDTMLIGEKSLFVGLSLHSMELSGKAILRAFGLTKEELRKQEYSHNVLEILKEAQLRVMSDIKTANLALAEFLSYAPQSIRFKRKHTIESALNELLHEEGSIKPRDYFYPDGPQFLAMDPDVVFQMMTRRLINSATQISKALGWEGDYPDDVS